MKISRETAKQLIYDTNRMNNGQIFGVTFIKKDGSIREMQARLGVKKHLKGGVLKFNPADYNLLVAFDMQKAAYRMINIDTLRELRVNKVIYTVE